MTGNTAFDNKVSLLRTVEQLCYQVAHFLLRNERDAAAASEEALLALARNPRFLIAEEAERGQIAKKAAMASAIQRVRAEGMPQMQKELTSHAAKGM
ncbi:hypothetical protein [Paenibacillus sp. R14(2021)]|uniref:hypothetical protein n=1 Tax=Paenibacillus sp. R14(2021) TaxID=2859228 RepID=UPI001C6116D6|nr:hypothetical protein [Paenibacillus sp. R14(2021)]